MNIVIPMAGHGERFRQAGEMSPKPMIDVCGRPLYRWAADSLPLQMAHRLIFVCLREHLQRSGLESDIKTHYSAYKPSVIALDETTQGPLCTVLRAWNAVTETEPLLVYSGDSATKTDVQTLLSSSSPWDGILDVSPVEGDQGSFVRCGSQGQVLETMVRRRVSSLACTGLFWFRSARQFRVYGEAMLRDDDRTHNEFHIAPLYNRMLDDGARVFAHRVQEYHPMGTPEQVRAFIDAEPLSSR